MKKILLNFSSSLLSREQMKRIKGGYGEEGTTCEAKCNRGKPFSRTCPGTGAACSATDPTPTKDGFVCCGVNDCQDCPTQ
ncbi:hypothetical protein GCM10027035_22870 [Emticicia sediminis]